MKNQFYNLPETKKGYIGEKLVKDYFEKRGYGVYETHSNTPHNIDFILMKDKQFVALVEVKTKERFNKYKQTGIDLYKMDDYIKTSKAQNLPLYFIFVDILEGKIYGNTLESLEQPREFNGKKYPFNTGKVRIYHLDTMYTLRLLTKEEIKKINSVKITF